MPQYQGIWTLAQAAQLQSTQRWATDPLFENTTLLLQADNAANGAQNNTFLDSSSNNFTITRNGNTTQGTFTPFSQSPGWWGNYFDGSSNLNLSTQAVLNVGTGNFTFECFAYFPNVSSSYSRNQVFGATEATASSALIVELSGATQGSNGIKVSICGTTVITYTTAIPPNTWHHIAVVREGTGSNQVKLYLNGTNIASGTGTGSLGTPNYNIGRLQANNSAFDDYYTGYLSNIRITNAALYTGNFTPSTTPLTTTVSAGTVSLLTCQSNRFVDNSTNAFAITVNGTPSVQAFSPFAPQYQYTPSVTGGSGYFDGTGDYLSAASNAAFNLGTGNFTLECWVYITSFASNSALLEKRLTSGSTAPWVWYTDTAGKLNFYTGTNYITTSSFPLNAWTHLVTSRVSGTLYQFINGVSAMTPTSVTTDLDTTGNLLIGTSNDITPAAMKGYIASIRLVKGSGVTSVTVPTAPLTAITNTSLLLNFTNAGIYDGTMKNNLETVGNAQVSTSVVKYGTGSMYFDGSGDYLTGPTNSPSFQFGTGDFTVEMWINTANITNYQTLLDVRSADTQSAWCFFLDNTGKPYWYDASGVQLSSTAVAANTWTHLAVSRLGSTLRMFLSGVQVFSGTNSNAQNPTGTFYVGRNAINAFLYTGYIDDLRITKGIARYTANFTPPTVALPRQ